MAVSVSPGVGHDEGEPVVGADHNTVDEGAAAHLAGYRIPLDVPPAISAYGLIQVTVLALWAPAHPCKCHGQASDSNGRLNLNALPSVW